MQGGIKSSDVATLGTANPDLLQHFGLAAGPASRLLNILQSSQILLTVPGISSSLVDRNVSFIGRIDHIPYDWKTLQPARTTWGLTAHTQFYDTEAQSLSSVSLIGHLRRSSRIVAG